MNCPTCHAKLLPVKGELFCLQCGKVVDQAAAEADRPVGQPAQRVIADLTPRQSKPPDASVAGSVSAGLVASGSVVAAGPVASVKLAGLDISAPVTKSATGVVPPPMVRDVTVAKPVAAAKPVVALVAGAAVGAVGVPQPVVSGLNLNPVSLRRSYLPWWTVAALVAVALLVVADVVVRTYYQDRVYPGVKVGNQLLGGETLSDASAAVKAMTPSETVKFTIGSTEYALKPSELGSSTNEAGLMRDVQGAGRNDVFALLGVIRTLVSKPFDVQYTVDDKVVRAYAEKLAAENSHPASDAYPLIVGSTPLVIAEKTGQQVSATKVHDSLLLALKNHQKITVSPTKLTPVLAAASFSSDIEDAQAKIGLNLSIKVKSTVIRPTPADIAGWLRFGDPGSGSKPDAGKVAAYVAGISGKFDRPETQAAIMGALTSKQALTYTANTKRNVALSAAASIQALPKTYSFCVAGRGASEVDVAAATTKIQSTLDDLHGWTLGGKLKFLSSNGNCNVTIWLASSGEMAAFAPACKGQSSCQVDNNVVINTSNWTKPAVDWKGSLDDYRTELINHEVGHWLGFDHAKCQAGAPSAPINQPTVTVSGCSPAWYAIPAELQGQKVLPGF